MGIWNQRSEEGSLRRHIQYDTEESTYSIGQTDLYKALAMKKTQVSTTRIGQPGTEDTRHPLQNPSQAPAGREAQLEYQCLDTKSRSDIANTYSPKFLGEKVV